MGPVRCGGRRLGGVGRAVRGPRPPDGRGGLLAAAGGDVGAGCPGGLPAPGQPDRLGARGAGHPRRAPGGGAGLLAAGARRGGAGRRVRRLVHLVELAGGGPARSPWSSCCSRTVGCWVLAGDPSPGSQVRPRSWPPWAPGSGTATRSATWTAATRSASPVPCRSSCSRWGRPSSSWSLGASVVSLVLRFVRSTGVERTRLTWVVLAAALMVPAAGGVGLVLEQVPAGRHRAGAGGGPAGGCHRHRHPAPPALRHRPGASTAPWSTARSRALAATYLGLGAAAAAASLSPLTGELRPGGRGVHARGRRAVPPGPRPDPGGGGPALLPPPVRRRAAPWTPSAPGCAHEVDLDAVSRDLRAVVARHRAAGARVAVAARPEP